MCGAPKWGAYFRWALWQCREAKMAACLMRPHLPSCPKTGSLCATHMRDLTPEESAAFATRSKGHFDELDHGSPLERLSQEPDRSGLQGARPITLVLKGRDKNNR